MNFKLNLNKFKKIGGDKHKTIMRHDDGHQITIAHNALSPKMRSQLAELPSAMADGGEVADKEQKDPALFDQIQAAYDKHIQPLIDQGAQNLKDRQQNAEDTTAILKDKINMQMNPELQGPRQEALGSLPAQQQYANDIGVGSATMGALGGANKAGSYMKNLTAADIEAGIDKTGGIARKLNRAAQEMPKVVKNSPEVEQAIKDANQMALKKATTPGEGMAKGGSIGPMNPKLAESKKVPRMDEGGEVNKSNAAEIQKGATESKPANFSYMKNLKEGLGMADGGEIDADINGPEESMGREPMKQLTEDKPEEDKKEDRKNYADGSADAPVGEEQSQQDPGQQQPTIIINNGQPAQNATPQQSVPQQLGGALRQSIADTGQAVRGVVSPVMNAASQFKQGFMGGQDPNAPQSPAPVTQPVVQEPANMPSAPDQAAQQQNSDPYGTGAAQDAFMGGYNNAIAGIKNTADIQSKLAQQNEGAYSEKAQQSKDLNDHFQNVVDNYNKNYNEIMKDIQEGHISPENYWKDHSKLATGIGIILAGFSPAGGPNSALDFLNNQMNRNLDAQKAELGKKHNLLSALHNQLGDMAAATSVFNNIQRGVLADQIQEAANKQGGPMAQATAKQLVGKLQMDSAQQIGQLAMRSTLLRSQADQNASANPDSALQQHLNAMRIVDPARAKEIESRYIPGVGMASVPVPQETRNVITERKTLGNNINQLMQFQQKYGGTLEGIADPNVRAYGEALAKQVQDQYRRANQQGVFKPAEAAFVNGVIADSPSSLFSSFTKKPGYKAAAEINQGNIKAAYDSIGLRPFQPMLQQGTQGYTPKSARPVK